jgi:hypothetical protein
MHRLIRDFLATMVRRVVARYHVWIVAASLVLTIAAIVAIALRWNINSDFKALLPQRSPAASAMDEVGDRVGSGSSLFVVIDSPSIEANKQFAKVFAEELRDLPGVALAHYHNDKTFFEQHQLLYVDSSDIRALDSEIQRKMRRAKQRANPLFVDLEDGSADGDGDLQMRELREKYEDAGAQSNYKEYLLSDDGYALTIVVRFVESSTDLMATNRLLTQIESLGQTLDPKAYHEEMTIEMGGGLVNRKREYNTIVDDIQSSAIFTVLGVLLLIGLYFRRKRAIVLVLGPLVMSVLWTLGLAFVFIGELTTISVFIFVILLGLGIDFGIHLLSSYDSVRAEGHDEVEALAKTFSNTGRATSIAALTTMATFVVISFAQFRGLSQFGTLASMGIALTLLAMIVVMPAMVLTFERIRPRELSEEEAERAGASALPAVSLPRSLTVPASLALAAGITIFAALHIGDLRFEDNFREIAEIEFPWERGDAEAATPDDAERARDSAADAARGLSSHIYERARGVRAEVEPDSFVRDREQESVGDKYSSAVQQSSTPTALLFDDPEAAHRVQRNFDRALASGELDTIRQAVSIYAFLPGTEAEQRDRLEAIAALRDTLQDSDLEYLEGEDRQRVERLRELAEVREPITIYDLPEWTKRLFREAGPEAREPAPGEAFAFEYLIYVTEKIDPMVGPESRSFLEDIEQGATWGGAPAELTETYRLASPSLVFVSMIESIQRDGVQYMGIALVLVLLLLLVALRHPARVLLVASPLLVGALWTFGIASWLGMRLDFFNMVIVPVMLGIGIDDGVHFYYRYEEEGRGSVSSTLRHIGAAILMTSVTDLVGFGGLAITSYNGLQSIGYLAFVAIGCTFTSTVLLMPSILWIAEALELDAVLPASFADSDEGDPEPRLQGPPSPDRSGAEIPVLATADESHDNLTTPHGIR